MTRHINATVLATSLIALGCATAPPPPPRETPTFDYNPHQSGAPGSAGVTFAVVSPEFPNNVTLFRTFAKNMADDFQEILTAQGYTARGPYRTHDEMTYPDKKGTDLLLMPEVDIVGELTRINWRTPSTGFGAKVLAATAGALSGGNQPAYYVASGEVVFTGRLNLVVAESLTGERMWTKSVPVDNLIVPLESKKAYDPNTVTLDQILHNEPEFYNAVVRAFEDFYDNALNKAYAYLHPEEMRLVKQQAQEVRARKVFQ